MADNKDVVGLTDEEILAIEEDEGDELSSDNGENVDEEPTANEEDAEQNPQDGDSANIEEPNQFIPTYQAEQPADIQQRIAGLSEAHDLKADELSEKYENGDIDFKDYQKQSRELANQFLAAREELVKQSLKAEIAEEQAQQAAAQKWQWEQDQFFTENKEFKSDPALYGALEATYLSLANSDAAAGKTSLQLLRQAANSVRTRFNLSATSETTKPMPRKSDKTELPKTLAEIPAAADNDGDGEFDYMDKLSGQAFENALAKMSKDQRERYEAA